jgi:ERF superfamily
MPRSSETVAALASALAKAQAELVNPEKTLTATIRSARPGDGERSFRYAPLSSGLDIIRKTLGQHEIATVQTTAVDQAAGLVNLTTMLAHASGEWIASDWPVCPITDMASPQRMGAALTYARRYALFTLVGIAGEDDLDAPDLCNQTLSPAASAADQRPVSSGDRTSALRNGQSRAPLGKSGQGSARGAVGGMPRTTLDPEPSAALCDQLLTEVAGLTSSALAAAWARTALPAKNGLTAGDAKLVEDAFERKLSELPSPDAAEPDNAVTAHAAMRRPPVAAPENADRADLGQATGIDKSVLTIAAPRRYRNRDHLRFVAQQPCLLCGRKPSDPHHLRHLQPAALGRKASDEFAVPLCRTHHRAAHRAGDERAWWKASGIDPIKAARKLWKETRLNEGRIQPIRRTPQAADAETKQAVGPDRTTQSHETVSTCPT